MGRRPMRPTCRGSFVSSRWWKRIWPIATPARRGWCATSRSSTPRWRRARWPSCIAWRAVSTSVRTRRRSTGQSPSSPAAEWPTSRCPTCSGAAWPPTLPRSLPARLVVSGAVPQPGKGLSELGRAAVTAMARERVLVDLSHMTEHALRDTFALLDEVDRERTLPVVASHAGYRFGRQRYMLDESAVEKIAERDGVIGLIFAQHQLTDGVRRGTRTLKESLEVLERHVERIREITGSHRHTAIGSDFDGFIADPRQPRVDGRHGCSGAGARDPLRRRGRRGDLLRERAQAAADALAGALMRRAAPMAPPRSPSSAIRNAGGSSLANRWASSPSRSARGRARPVSARARPRVSPRPRRAR